ncbi:hypothetical protein LJC42_00310 [Eubacteriales bacterium OttesenSCG-928-K08]|nr:hypothetical protein [Eubacteriales bacterium OttesenSCG-928-K08]
MPEGVELVYQNKLEFDITPTEAQPTWAQVCKGFTDVSESLNEVVEQFSYLCSEGWGYSEVVGGQYTNTLTGHRYIGDAFQDWLFDPEVQLKFGSSRKTRMRITSKSGLIVVWDVTLANITASGGNARATNAISVTIHGNGAPEIETVTP